MSYSLAAAVFVVCVLCLRYWRQTRRSISHLPGPPSGSWLVGNIPSFQRAENAADADFEWTRKYGNAFRIKGCFGEDILYLSDPKAMQYILNQSGYNFPKTRENRARLKFMTGNGVLAVDGAQHARQRRVMNPSFSHSVLKGFLPLFLDMSRRTTETWKTMIRYKHTETVVMDVSSLLSHTTLDIIGEAAFGYKFNSIESVKPKTELHQSYQNLFADINHMPTDSELAFRRIIGYIPMRVSDILTSLPKKDLQRLKKYTNAARNIAKDLVEKELIAHANGKEGGRDVMSLCVKANSTEDPKRKLEDEELISQITTLMLAGHETTANSLTWALYELSRHPEVQRKLRDEVRAIRANVASRGDSEVTVSDLDSMEYLAAVMKETLRYHPIAVQLFRQAGRDDIIPLDTPQHAVSGDVITAIPVRKGQKLQLGLASYNRIEELWGQDAHEWRPERFLEGVTKNHKTNLGVYGNLATFSSGFRGCIGWRFSLIEMQAVLFELMDNFEFNPAPGIEIKRAITGIMQSMVKGQEDRGTQLPLAISIISKDADR